jgi:hypothetical protein
MVLAQPPPALATDESIFFLKADSNELKRVEYHVRTFWSYFNVSRTEASDSATHGYVQLAAIGKSGILCRLLFNEGVARM